MDELEPIDETFEGFFSGLIQKLEWDRLLMICRHFDIEVTKENFAYCFSIKTVYDGFLLTLYQVDDRGVKIEDPEGKAFDLTAAAMRLFKKHKLPPPALKYNRERE